jgi:hypothetical protein
MTQRKKNRGFYIFNLISTKKKSHLQEKEIIYDWFSHKRV